MNVKNPPISARDLKFDSEMISLSDFIEWKDFTVNTFGVMPPSHLFKKKVTWTQFLRLMIEKAYANLDLDPETYVENKKIRDRKSVSKNTKPILHFYVV